METRNTEKIEGTDTGDEIGQVSVSAFDSSTSETPEDVAVLYSWANLQGAKYRDFSASRREYRAQMRHRAAEQLRAQELKAAAEAEAAAAAAEAEAALAVKAAQLAEHPNPQEAEYARQLALYEADQAARKAASERLEAVRRADAAAYAASVAEHEVREIAEAQASSIRQAAQYAVSEVKLRQSGMHARAVVPGKISDPYAPPELAAGGIFDQPGMPVSELEATRFRKVREAMDQGSGTRPAVGHDAVRKSMPTAEGHRPRGFRPDEPSRVHSRAATASQDSRSQSEGQHQPRRYSEPHLSFESNNQQGLPSTPYSEYKRATSGGELKIAPRPEMPVSAERVDPRRSDAPAPAFSFREPVSMRRQPAEAMARELEVELPRLEVPRLEVPRLEVPRVELSESKLPGPGQPGWDVTRMQPKSKVQAYTAGALENEASQTWQPVPEGRSQPMQPPQTYTAAAVLAQQTIHSERATEQTLISDQLDEAGRFAPMRSSEADLEQNYRDVEPARGREMGRHTNQDADWEAESTRSYTEFERVRPGRHAATPAAEDRHTLSPSSGSAAERVVPAWLSPSADEITRVRPAAAGAPSLASLSAPLSIPTFSANPRPLPVSDSGQKANQTQAMDTLHRSREHVASRWFALKGIFDQPIRTGSSDAVVHPFEEIATPVLAVFSLAGGVGKTSLVATLGRTLSSMGEKVLLTDTTSHGLLPFYFGATELLAGVVRTFSPPAGSTDAPIALVNYAVDSQWIEPATSNDGFSGRESEYAASRLGVRKDERSDRRSSIDGLADDLFRDSRTMHRILLDLTNESAFVIRRMARLKPVVLVPLAPDMNSVISLQAVLRFLRGMRDVDGGAIEPYFVLNQFDSALPLHLDVREVLGQQLGRQLLPFVIRRTPSVSEALAEGMTVVDYAPESAIAQDYRNVASWLRSVSPPLNATGRNARWSER